LERAAEHRGAQVFHAGTTRSPAGEWLTAGGRVLGITAKGKTLDRALQRCYDAVGEINWDGMHYRRDIGRFIE
jgi:phosphoribosylamine--glycine ligase